MGCRPSGLIHIQQVRSIERFHRTLAEGWAFRRLYTGESQRRKALPGWIHEYNHHRPHTAIGGQPPISRLTNLSDQYS
jgi:transposase InsO family protein